MLRTNFAPQLGPGEVKYLWRYLPIGRYRIQGGGGRDLKPRREVRCLPAIAIRSLDTRKGFMGQKDIAMHWLLLHRVPSTDIPTPS